MIPASASIAASAVILAVSFQAHRFELADMQEKAREDAAATAHKAKETAEKREREERERQREASRSKPRPPSPAPAGSPKDIARALVPAGQWACFDFIISHESGWSVTARNPSSGAYGLAQALPPTKYAKYGSDWRTNPLPQLKFAVAYMNGRYGSPCGAMSFWKSHHWY